MAGRYDGSIRINTLIDTKNAAAQIMSLENRITKTADKMAALRSKMDALRDAKIPTQEYQEISEQIAKAEQEFDKLLEKQEQMQREGKDNGTAWERLNEKMDEAGNTIRYAKGELQDLVDTGKAFTIGSDTQEYAQLRQQLQYAENDMEVLNQRHEALELRQSRNADGYKKISDSAKKLGNVVKSIYSSLDNIMKGVESRLKKIAKTMSGFFSNTKKSADINSNAMKNIFKNFLKYGLGIRSFYALVNKLRNGIKEGLQNFAQYSSEYNKAMTSLKSANMQLKNSFATAFAPIAQIVIPYLVQLIQYIIRALNAVSQFMAVLSGKSTWTRAVEVQEDYAAALGATSESAKSAVKALAGFDKLNVLGKNDSGSGAGGTDPKDMFEEVALNEQQMSILTEKIEKMKDVLAHLFNPLREAWTREGKFVMDSWKYALDEIWALLKQIGKDFLRMWDSAETVNILADILHIIGDIGLIVGHLAKNFREAWAQNDTGYKILCNIRDIIGVIVHNMRLAADYTVEWADSLDFYPLLSKLEEWTRSLIPVYDALSGIVTDFYTMVLLPLGKWTLEKGLPELLQVFIDFNSKVDWEGLRANLQEFWEHLEPFAETVGEGLIIFISRVSDALADFLNSDVFVGFLHAVENWMDNVTPQDVADGMGNLVKALIAFKAAMLGLGVIKGLVSVIDMLKKLMPVVDKIGKVLMKLATFGSNVIGVFELMSNAGMTLGEAMSAIFGSAATAISGIVSIVGGVILAVTNFVGMLKEGFSWIKEIAMVAGTALAAIGAVILGAPALIAGIVAAVVAAVGTIIVLIHDNWDAICEWFSGVAEWIETNVIQPVIDSFRNLWNDVSGFFSSLWNDITNIWTVSAGWFNDNVILPIAGFFQGLWTRVGQIFEGLWIIVQAIWKIASDWFNENVIIPITDFFQELWEAVSGFFSNLWQDIVDVWENVSDWFNENVIIPVTDFFEGVWEDVSQFFSNLWNDIKAVWHAVADWFDDSVIAPVQKAFETACDAIGGFFESLWNGIKRGVAGAMNAVIGSIEGALNWLVDGINGIISGFNRVVSWAANIIEVDWGGVDLLPRVSLGRIPALADGAVIRGGDPFMAILGDQPKGQTNIETPLPTMVKAFKQALAESGMMSGEMTIRNQTILDGKMLSESVRKYNREYFSRTGKTLFEF